MIEEKQNIIYTCQDVELVDKPDYEKLLRKIEDAGRVCYNSQADKNDLKKSERFIKMLLKRGHESVIEHGSLTFKIRTDRAIANELVRHRLASYSQSSTRYIKYDQGLKVIVPEELYDSNKGVFLSWTETIKNAYEGYVELIESKVKPENARSVLPLCTATELYMTMNIRELRHFLKLRTHKSSHPDMRILANKMLNIVKKEYPVFFYNIGEDNEEA